MTNAEPREESATAGSGGAALRARALATRGWTGLMLFIGGCVLTGVVLDPLGGLDAIIKMALLGVALLIGYRGLDILYRSWRGPGADTGLTLCVTWLVALGLAAAFAGVLPLGEHLDVTDALSEPGNSHPDLLSAHPLGTNNFSLDLLARCIYGARVSLLTSFFAVAVSLVLGGVLGLVAGYRRGRTEVVIGVLTDTLLAYPALVLLIALAAALGQPETVPEAIVKGGAGLALVALPTMARLARANTLVHAQREFVLASRGMGASDRRIMVRELLPNIVLPMVSYAFIIVAVLIVAEGSLAFLGLGLQQPKPTWGNMIAEGDLQVLRDHPHIPLAPGIFMFLTVYSFNRVGEHARNRWDPPTS